jgi:WD40 repeat protein/tRNA A-37 threonylcarbamoyl transferase component Bud32
MSSDSPTPGPSADRPQIAAPARLVGDISPAETAQHASDPPDGADHPPKREQDNPTTSFGTGTADFHAVDDTAGETFSPAALPCRIGRFEIRRLLGEGAFGAVYEAYDPQLERTVALKVAKLDRGDAGQRVKRFLREAKAAAGLRHPHIVPVFEFGEQGNRFYIAAAFIRGRTLQAEIKDCQLTGARPDFTRAAQVVRMLAEALAYAHAQGVVHRDVKPANVLVDEKGEPFLADFGLATRQEEAEKLTHAGVVLGTPLYMAPEQARGEQGARAASDQYSLGVMLFEMLTGAAPFQGTAELVIFHHQHTEAPRPRSPGRKLPADLETICLKCLEKDPARRYADCQALADDLRRWLEGEPIRARRAGALERTAKWCRRNKVVAGLLAAVIVLLVGGVITSTLLAVWARSEAGQARLEQGKALWEKDQADKARIRAEGFAYASYTNLAAAEWERGNVLQALRWLDTCRWDKRGWEHDYLHQTFTTHRQGTLWHEAAVQDVAFSRDGSRVVSASRNGFLRIWDVPTGQERHRIRWEKHSPQHVRFGATDADIVSVSPEGWLHTWDAEGGRTNLLAIGPQDLVAISAGGRPVAAVDGEGTLTIREARPDRQPLIFKNAARGVSALAFSGDGCRLACADGGVVRILNAQTGAETAVWRGHTGSITCLAFHAAGARLACAAGSTVKTWDADTKTEEVWHGHAVPITCLAYSPDGARLASAGSDGIIHLWKAGLPQPILTLQGHVGPVHALAFSSDGSRLASAGADRTLKLWDARAGQQAFALPTAGAPNALAIAPDGERCACATADMVGLWNLRNGELEKALGGGDTPFRCVAFSPEGGKLAWAGHKQLKVHDLDAGADLWALPIEHATWLAFSADGRQLACAVWKERDKHQGEVSVFDVSTGELVSTLPPHEHRITAAALRPDGLLLATASAAIVRLWKTDTGQEGLQLAGHLGEVGSICFSPDGLLLACAGGTEQDPGEIKIWNTRTGQEAQSLRGHAGKVTSLAFSKDGTRLASGSADRTVKLWDIASATETLTLRGHDQAVTHVAFSSDGRRLFSAGAEGALTIWDAGTGRRPPTLHHPSRVYGVAFHPTQDVLATASWGGTLRLWDARTGAELHTLRGGSELPTENAFWGQGGRVVFSSDGRRLAVASGSRVMTLDTDLEAPAQSWQPLAGAITFSPDGGRLASASSFVGPGKIELWHPASGELATTFAGHADLITSLAYHPQGSTLASASFDKAVRLTDAQTGATLMTFRGHTAAVYAVTYSPDGARLASGGADGIRIWDAATGQELWYRAGHDDKVHALAFSPDGRFLASAAFDGSVKLWAAHSGAKVLELRGHIDAVAGVAFSPQGDRLASASLDGTVKIWRLEQELAKLNESPKSSPTRSGTGSWAADYLVMDPDGLGLTRASLDGRRAPLMGLRPRTTVHLDGGQVEFGEPAKVVTEGGMTKITRGENWNIPGFLSAGDPKDRVRTVSPSKVHRFLMPVGETFTVDLVGRDFDAFLRIEDADGKQLAFNDDAAANNQNARIVFQSPRTQDYRLIVTSFDSRGGDYVLCVTKGTAAPPKVIEAEALAAQAGAVLPLPQIDGSLKWSWSVGKVHVSQTAKLVRDTRGLPQAVVIAYHIENQDDRPHVVGIRHTMDPMVTAEGGRFLALPGKENVVASALELNGANVPSVLRIWEKRNPAGPGLTAHLALRAGPGQEPPDRVLLTRLPEPKLLASWTVEPSEFTDDPAVILYWQPRALRPGERRVVGYRYGLVEVSTTVQ